MRTVLIFVAAVAVAALATLATTPPVAASCAHTPAREVALVVSSCATSALTNPDLAKYADRYAGVVIEAEEGTAKVKAWIPRSEGVDCRALVPGAAVRATLEHACCDGEANPPCYLGIGQYLRGVKVTPSSKGGPLDVKDWEAAKQIPEPQPTLVVAGASWVLVDEIDILDKDSEDKHAFAIKEANDSYRSRQKLKYPDGTTLEDVGRGHVDGYSEFKITNITPKRPVVILRRFDYAYGDYELEISVNGKKATTVSCAGADRVNRWRNWPAAIPADAVTAGTLLLRQQSLTAGRDVNMFHIWVYQPK
jgi:hypothetical protein